MDDKTRKISKEETKEILKNSENFDISQLSQKREEEYKKKELKKELQETKEVENIINNQKKTRRKKVSATESDKLKQMLKDNLNVEINSSIKNTDLIKEKAGIKEQDVRIEDNPKEKSQEEILDEILVKRKDDDLSKEKESNTQDEKFEKKAEYQESKEPNDLNNEIKVHQEQNANPSVNDYNDFKQKAEYQESKEPNDLNNEIKVHQEQNANPSVDDYAQEAAKRFKTTKKEKRKNSSKKNKRKQSKKKKKKNKKRIFINILLIFIVILIVCFGLMYTYNKLLTKKYMNDISTYPEVSLTPPIKEDIVGPILTNEQAKKEYSEQVIGYVSIPAINMKAPIVQAPDSNPNIQDDFMKGTTVHDPSTDLPGEGGRTVIAGHREEYFNALQNIKVGDLVILYIGENLYLYEVTDAKQIADNKKGEEEVFDGGTDSEETIALYTCYPFNKYSKVDGRWLVEGKRISEYDKEIIN